MFSVPIIDMLVNYTKTIPLSFHVPGHRNGQGLSSLLLQEPLLDDSYKQCIRLFGQLMQYDVTELSITDDLHDPQSAIKLAQQKAARLYRVNHTMFLVGGSTAGNIASILATCEEDDVIIMQRNVHKSVINGCKLAGVNVVFLDSEIDKQSGYSTIPHINTVYKAIKKYPQAKAVFFSTPNYYGISCPLDEYVKLIHKYQMLVIVDEAHGAHYGFHPKLPKSAIECGADLVVQSTHKTLQAMTMGAMLHINTDKVNIADIQQQLAMIESSSPSFILLASVDLARATMECYGYAMIEKSLSFRQILNEFLLLKESNISVAIYDDNNNQKHKFDPLRLHLYDKSNKLTGYELQKLFEEQGVWIEMATAKHCILMLHLGYSLEELSILKERLLRIDDKIRAISSTKRIDTDNIKPYNKDGISEPVKMNRLSFKEHQTAWVSLDDAVGYKSAEMVIPYPPGIPIIYIGERITASNIEEIEHYRHHKTKFQGNESIFEGKLKIIVN